VFVRGWVRATRQTWNGFEVSEEPKSQSANPASLTPGVADWDLTGDLSRMPIIAVLQFLELSRQTGVLVIQAEGGMTHQFQLCEGAVVGALSRHLRGRDAAMAILGLKSGRFAFGAREIPADLARMNVTPLIMESVRLEDELERLSAFLPDEQAPLVLRSPHEIPIDPLECGADTVMATIAARPRVTMAQLEQIATIAPAKMRLAVAWLSSTGRLRSSQSVSIHAARASNHWYSKMQVFYPGGLRVLLAVHPERAARDLIAAITALAKELDSGPAWMSVALDGGAIARVRPRAGGLLSLACLPGTPAHDASFRTFANTAGLVLLDSDVQAELLGAWEAAVPSRVARRTLRFSKGAGYLVEAMRGFAEKLDIAPVARAKEGPGT
jgi:hypothetical protein